MTFLISGKDSFFCPSSENSVLFLSQLTVFLLLLLHYPFVFSPNKTKNTENFVNLRRDRINSEKYMKEKVAKPFLKVR